MISVKTILDHARAFQQRHRKAPSQYLEVLGRVCWANRHQWRLRTEQRSRRDNKYISAQKRLRKLQQRLDNGELTATECITGVSYNLVERHWETMTVWYCLRRNTTVWIGLYKHYLSLSVNLCLCSILPIWKVSTFMICRVPTSLVLHIRQYSFLRLQ